LRAKAKEERGRMRAAFQGAKGAEIRGDWDLVLDLEKKGQEHKENMERWNREASDEIFAGTFPKNPIYPLSDVSFLSDKNKVSLIGSRIL
jgi:hypothetical protein